MKTSKSTADEYVDQQTRDLLAKRDPAFLSSLFSEVNPYLVRVCLSNSIFGADTDEVIHNTWESFFSKLERFEGRSQIRTYVCGILFNKIREYRRSQSRFVYEDDSENVLNQAFTAEGWWKYTPPDPSRLLHTKELMGFMNECLEGLSEQQKAAFVMREVEDENSDTICNFLEVNLTHLRVLLFRAKDKLRKCLEGKAGADGAQLDTV